MRPRFLPHDPRVYQIATLSGLLLYGTLHLGLEVEPLYAALALATALLTQWGAGRLAGRPAFDPKSAWISGLSLALLLRAGSPLWVVVAAVLAVGSKFVLRYRGKHLFNPTNFGIVATMLASGQVWVSPGQWGSGAWFAFLLAGLGILVVVRSARSDITLAFLGFYSAILLGRAAWLGQPLRIPLHQLESGALLIFAFFMISDPKTTPDSRRGRILFAALVALGAGTVHFVLYRQNGLLLSLAGLSPLVPLLDRLLPGERYAWSGRNSGRRPAAPAADAVPAGRREAEPGPLALPFPERNPI
jgi:Na+-translocating ferredoxin:NAD+ oxidoreductase RnfD subunit